MQTNTLSGAMSGTSPGRLLTIPPTMPQHTPAGMVGNTPLLWIGEPFCGPLQGFWAKLEGHNPGGIKDRTALYMVERAHERGELAPGATIVESTSGTLGLGLALAGITYGHPVKLVTDPGMEPLMARLLTAYGAVVHTVTEPHPTGGWQQARRDRIGEILADDPTAYCPDQYNNPDNVAAYAPLAHELIAHMGRIDTLVVAVGTGGHSAGISRTLREFFPHLYVVGVDTIGSTIFGQPALPRIMRGLGSSIHPRNVDYGAFNEVHWVDAAQAVRTSRTLASSHYATGGWSVGAVATVARWLSRTRPVTERIIAVFPDGPQRYFDTVFNDEYCSEHGLLGQPLLDEPDEIAESGERVVIRWTRCTRVNDPREDMSVTSTSTKEVRR
ncbi:PLP-dependent cysteine synthase family protein [Nocardiopsis alborubida]|uniref:PLP-dependent cysteine synthase family protein n=1 Tax=Nocardiopsis alborubida TaxID=146802 RepID=A0A7X6MDR6_9ACTN|nr:PLP-dependent cysteine synthase family protein [Nocardiopsis alborubida]NKY99065.1 PLP-dependent cysteine synthase family protein [Nocardiopsis alborubida]